MVDAERLRRILQRISDDTATLARYKSEDRAELLTDPVRLGHLKYLFVTAIEGCVDAAQHVCSAEGWGPPESNADAIRVLARQDAVDTKVAESIARAVGFRNVLVHGYARIDDSRVLDALDRLHDLNAFVAALASLIA